MTQTEIMLQEADTFLENGNMASAMDLYNQIIEIEPQQSEAYAMMGAIYGEQGNFPQAIESLNKALEVNSKNADAWLTHGLILQQMGNKEFAFESFRKAIQHDSENDIAHYSFANMLLEMGESQKAVASYQETVRCNPKNSEAWYMLAGLLQSIGANEDAIQGFLRVLSIDPAHLGATQRAITLQTQLNKLDDAEETANTGLATHPQDAVIHNCVAILRAHQARLPEALDLAKKAKELDPSNTDSSITYAEILVQDDNPEKALEELRPLLETQPPVFNAVIAFVRFAPGMGMKSEAISLLDKLKQSENLDEQQSQLLAQADSWLQEQP